MSIPVRLIGGINDGEVIKVDSDQVEIRRMKARSVPVSRSFSLEPISRVIDQSRYTRRVVNVGDDQVIFFAVDTMSDLDAVQHVLGP